MIRPPFPPRRAAFSLVELLVVIGIIALLAGILFPTISKVRSSAQEADSRAVLNQIDQACQAYYTDFKAYPGPLSNAMLDAVDQTFTSSQDASIVDSPTGTVALNTNLATLGTSTTATTFGPIALVGSTTGGRVTGSENLVLGLCGGLAINRMSPTVYRYYFDPSAIGQGPANFNPIRPSRSTAYLQPTNLSKGRILDESGTATGVDSIIPEFVDRFATPMPILYMRSRGLGGTSTSAVETLVVNNAAVASDYNIIEIQPYTSYRTGSGGTLKPSDYVNATFSASSPHGLQLANPLRTIDKGNKINNVQYQYPYDAYDYLVDPASYDRSQTTLSAAGYGGKRVRKKDSYVLISAGKDRIYGTADDVTNFGSVQP